MYWGLSHYVGLVRLFEENGKSVRCLSIGRFMTKETGLQVYNAIKETEGESPWVKSDWHKITPNCTTHSAFLNSNCTLHCVRVDRK